MNHDRDMPYMNCDIGHLHCKTMRAIVLLLLSAATVLSDHAPNQYIINLDLPPAQRWSPMLQKEKHLVDALNLFYSEFVPPFLVPLIEKLAGALDEYLPYPYAQEIKGMAEQMNVTVGVFLVPNIVYDMAAFCTSIVAEDSQRQIWHGRNLDYGQNDVQANILRNITFLVHFQRGGKTVYSAVTYGGYIGIITGQKPNKFTFSLDQRGKNKPVDFLFNVLIALLDKKAKLTGFLIRDTFEAAEDFETAVSTLSHADTIAPSYMIVGGVKPGQGAVLTKARLGMDDQWRLDVTSGRWYLVETNFDHWLPPGDSRRETAMAGMNATGPAGLNATSLYNVLSTYPVLNRMTTFTCVMSAAQPRVFQAQVRDDPK